MKGYWSVISVRFRELLQYRLAAFAGFTTQLFWGLIRVMIFQAFFSSGTRTQPMDVESVTTYIWLGQALFAMIPFRPNADLAKQIKEGTVVYEMLRPLNIYWFWYCRAIAERVAPMILRATPMFIVAGLFFGLKAPAGWEALLFSVISFVLAVGLAASISTIITITLLWTISGGGVVSIMGALIFFFTGLIVPLPFFPDQLYCLAQILPFRGILDTPCRIYTGYLAEMISISRCFIN